MAKLIRGTAGDDLLFDLEDRDGAPDLTPLKILGFGGNDRIIHAIGDDVIDGGRDDDTIIGNGDVDFHAIERVNVFDISEGFTRRTIKAGDDRVSMGPGNDVAQAGAGKDIYDGGSGFDVLTIQPDLFDLSEVRNIATAYGTSSVKPMSRFVADLRDGTLTFSGMKYSNTILNFGVEVLDFTLGRIGAMNHEISGFEGFVGSQYSDVISGDDQDAGFEIISPGLKALPATTAWMAAATTTGWMAA